MSSLKMKEKKVLERLFDRGGYVLDFTNATYAEFFREHRINIDNNKYYFNGPSKMKRLRAFWEIEPDNIVGKVLESLLEYASCIDDNNIDEKDKKDALSIIYRLQGKRKTARVTEEDFLKTNFENISIEKLGLEGPIEGIIHQRLKEIKECLASKSALATIFLCGSTLEGILLGVAMNNPKTFNSSDASPKNNNGKVFPFQRWTLKDFINVAKDIGFLKEDVKKFSHSLRDFRNYIHPYEQAANKFNPDEHTARICWQVLQAAIFQIIKKRSLTK